MMQTWMQGALAVVVAGVVAWAWARWFEWSRLYRFRARLAETPADRGLAFEEVSFVAEDGVQLHGWWIPAPGACGTLIYCHGNGDNVGDLVGVAADLHARGLNVFLWDYRGYGRSRGIPTEQGTYRDARAAFEVVRARHDGVEDPPVLVLGRSLGGAVAVQLACDKPVRGLILESTFTSTVDVGLRWYPNLPVRWMVRFRYDSASKVPGLRLPLLVAHSPEDEAIPIEHGRALFEAAPGPKRFVELAGFHNEAGWNTAPEYLSAIEAFARTALGTPGEA